MWGARSKLPTGGSKIFAIIQQIFTRTLSQPSKRGHNLRMILSEFETYVAQVPEVKCSKIPTTRREEVCNWAESCFRALYSKKLTYKPTIWLPWNLLKLQFWSQHCKFEWKFSKHPTKSFLVTRLFSCWNLSEIYIYVIEIYTPCTCFNMFFVYVYVCHKKHTLKHILQYRNWWSTE